MYELKPLRELAQVIVKSGLFRHLPNVDACLAVMLIGLDYGISPVAACSQIHVLHGKPTLSAGAQAAIAKRDGKYTWIVKQINDDGCSLMFLQRAGDKWQEVGPASFTFEEAKRAGLTRNATWQKFRQDLLFARALSRGCRRYCADQFGGTAYTEGELDEAPAPDAPGAPAPAPAPAPADLAFDTVAAVKYAVSQGIDADEARALADGLSDTPAAQQRKKFFSLVRMKTAL